MPAPDAEPRDPFAAQADLLRRTVEAQRDQQAEAEERQRQRHELRQAAIEGFVQIYPAPDALRPVERDEWSNEVRRVAERVIPQDSDRAPDPSDFDYRWMYDETGSTFLALRAERVAALRQELADIIQRGEKLESDLAFLRTVPARSAQTRDQTKGAAIRPRIANAFTDEELELLSIQALQERIVPVRARVNELERELHSARTVGPGGLGSMRAPAPPGRSGTWSSGDSGQAVEPPETGAARSEGSSQRRYRNSNGQGRHYYIRSISDSDESDSILREVLKLSQPPLSLDASRIARRLQARLGAAEPPAASTVRTWLGEARRMETHGIPF